MLKPRLLAPVTACLLLGACGADTIVAPVDTGLTGRRLSVGEATTCALDSAGTVFCWGTNSAFWEYGADPATRAPAPLPVPVPVPALSKLSGGAGPHMCGLTTANAAICWGRGGFGQLGGGAPGNTSGNGPTSVAGGIAWSDIYVSRLTTCGVSILGTGFCWGLNQRGVIGDSIVPLGDTTKSPSPIGANKIFKSVVTGWLHACGIATSGAAYCWGDNTSGQLGIGFADASVHNEPLLVSFTETFVQLSLGSKSTCGITPDHHALCWGLNSTGQLGDGTTTQRTSPTVVAGGLKFVQIAVGSGFAGGTNVALPNTGGLQASWAHTCALTETGVPYCWGWNGAGQVGDGTTNDRVSPVAVQGNLRVSVIGLGGSSTCGMRGNAVWCWGSNYVGQLGNGTFVNSPVPVAVLGPFAKP